MDVKVFSSKIRLFRSVIIKTTVAGNTDFSITRTKIRFPFIVKHYNFKFDFSDSRIFGTLEMRKIRIIL